MKQILFVHSYNTPFILRDLEILKGKFTVEDFDLTNEKKNLFSPIKMVFNLIQKIRNNEITYLWFADFRAFLAVFLGKIFHKNIVVIIGGYELANYPQYNYGALQKKSRAWRVKQIIKYATKILTVDDSLKIDAENLLNKKLENIETVPTGYKADKFFSNGEKENLVMTVAMVAKVGKAKLKGLEAFIGTAKLLPEIQFKIIGMSGDAFDWAIAKKPDNLMILPLISEAELLGYFQKTKVYCQLSCREGLPNALCEAMLCECIPVGTKHNGIPTAIGDTGYYAEFNDINSTKKAIENALKKENGFASRERIIKLFPEEKRTKELVRIIGELL